jgi:hypothetical protein
LTKLLRDALPAQQRDRIDCDALSSLFIMAYDGFVINRRLNALTLGNVGLIPANQTWSTETGLPGWA